MKKIIVSVATVAILGALTLGCIKVVKLNIEANEVNASVVSAEDEIKAEQELEVTTETIVNIKDDSNTTEVKKKVSGRKIVKVEDKEIIGSEKDIDKVKIDKDAKDKIETAIDKAKKYKEYFELNGVKTPEEIASMGSENFHVSDSEWANAKAEWLKANPDYDENFAEKVRGEYETAKWYEILEYYGIHASDNEKGYEYIQNPIIEGSLDSLID